MKAKLNINKNLLKAKVIEKGFRMNDVAKELKITPNLLQHKLIRNSFWLNEILAIQQMLDLSVSDFSNIFFEGGLSFFDMNEQQRV